MTISTRAILIAAIILNAISIGLSEVQRRELGQHSTDATLQLRDIERQRLEQQAVELDRTYKLLAEINKRISSVELRMNNVEIAVQSGHTVSEIQDISQRLKAVQVRIESLKEKSQAP